MANSFKSDDSFLRKLALGAAGTNATISRLREMGFNPIELERGSTGFKIWKKIKIKRVRVPDIFCLDTGLRFESRGKTKLEISMSHSLNDPRRVWDFGMRDDDFVSIVMFEQSEESPLGPTKVSPIHFITVEDMRYAFTRGQVSTTKAKGVEEGSEIRVVWPCAVAKQKSVVATVESAKIILTSVDNGGRQIIQLNRARAMLVLKPQMSEGATVEVNQIVASVVPVYTTLSRPAPVDENYLIEKLTSVNLSERYAAAKALRYRGYSVAKAVLEERMSDKEEDIYVQLEAAAALAAGDDPKGWEFMEEKLHSPVLTVPLETQLETVIVASEIPNARSEQLLIMVLKDDTRDTELRAGAAWALGQFVSSSSAAALVDTFATNPSEIKVEAARALLRIAEPQVPQLVELLRTGDPSKRDGISWVLARTGKFDPTNLVLTSDDNLRRWISYIIGYGQDKFLRADIEAICNADPEVYFATSVLWQILASWIKDVKEY